ncbi:MAG: BatD family protein [Planctomycetota bacterium]
MRRALIALWLAASTTVAAERVFVETVTSRDSYFLYEPVPVTLRVVFDEAFLRSHGVQMFHYELDVPVQVDAPWVDGLKGAVLREGADSAGARLTIVLNEAVFEAAEGAAREIDGRTYGALEITRVFVPTQPGDLAIPAAKLRFAHAKSFREDFIHGRTPVDQKYTDVASQPATVRILPLPDAGRPSDYGGAVGRFTVRAETSAGAVKAREIFKLTLRIEGAGNLEFIDPPQLGMKGFHVYGSIDDKGAARRTITYDVAALSGDVSAVPAIAFPYFDPGEPPGYRVARTEPVPLTVHAQPEEQGTRKDPPEKEAETPRAVYAFATVAALAALALGLWLRSRRRDRFNPAREAAESLRANSDSRGADLADLLSDYLSARLGCPAAAVITPDLADRLVAAGVGRDLATRTAKALEQWVDARYGGAASDDHAGAEAREIVDALDAAFARRR